MKNLIWQELIEINSKALKTVFEKTISLENLVSNFIQLIHDYYDIELTATYKEFQTCARTKITDETDELFLEWVESEGIQELKELAALNLTSGKSITAKIEMIISTLVDEMTWVDRDKESTFSTVINNLTGLKEELNFYSSLELEQTSIITAKVDEVNREHKYDMKYKPLESSGSFIIQSN